MRKERINFKKIRKSKIFQVIICILIAAIIYGVIVLINSYRNYVKIDLKANTNSIFTLSDISVSNLVYGDLEDTAVTIFGKPTKIETFKDGKQKYKTYYYDGLELTFKEQNKSYVFMKAIITSDSYMATRDIRVGDRINDVMNKFFIENTKSEYLYGNHNENDLDGKSVKENVFFGHRTKKLVYYLYTDAPYKKTYASLSDEIAQITFKVSLGKVKRIELLYGPLE